VAVCLSCYSAAVIFAEILSILLGFALLCFVVYWVVVAGPARRQGKQERRVAQIQAIEAHKVSRNHQDLFLLVNDLLALQHRGYQVVFPDQELLKRAEEITATYRNEVSI